jgi:hypothetical protein
VRQRAEFLSQRNWVPQAANLPSAWILSVFSSLFCATLNQHSPRLGYCLCLSILRMKLDIRADTIEQG